MNAERQRLPPSSRVLQFEHGKVECIQVCFCKVVPSSDVTLRLGLWKPRSFLQEVLLSYPRQDRPEILAGFIGRAAKH